MTRTWADSYEKVLQRQEDERRGKKQAEERSRMAFYNDLLERQRRERERMLEEARDVFFKQKDEPKVLESALMCSEMLREQHVQREFNKALRQEEKEREKQYAQEINEKSNEWNHEQKMKRHRRREHDIQHAHDVKTQAEDMRNRITNEHQQNIDLEKNDFENAHKEMAMLEKFAQDIKLKERNNLRKQIQGALASVIKRREEEKQLDKLEDKLILIYENANCKILRLRKQKEKEMEEERIRRREFVSRLPDVRAERAKKEDERSERAKKEKEALEDNVIAQKKLHKEKMNEDRRQCYDAWVKKDTQRRADEKELKTWELANRYENAENTRLFNAHMKEKRRLLNLENKEFILMQQRELKEKIEKEKAEKLKFFRDDKLAEMAAADHKFLTYANNLLKECDSVNRPTQPIQKVINDYKLRYLAPPKRLAQHLKTHFSSNNIDSGEIKQKPGKKFMNHYPNPGNMEVASTRSATCCAGSCKNE